VPGHDSELSDLSVGTVEGEEGWNTVIVRTARGEDLLNRAESKGALETRVYPEDKWAISKRPPFSRSNGA